MPQWVTQKKFIEQTGLNYGAVRCWRDAGLIPAQKIHDKWMLDLEAFNESLTEKAEAIKSHAKPLTHVIDLDQYLLNAR